MVAGRRDLSPYDLVRDQVGGLVGVQRKKRSQRSPQTDSVGHGEPAGAMN